VFVRELGGGPVAIGSVGVLWMLWSNLPQILLLPFTHRGGRVKPPTLWTSLLLRMLFLVLALLSAFVVGTLAVNQAIATVLGIVVLICIAGSMAGPPWQQLYTLTVPVPFRGRLLALRQFVSAIFGIGAGWISGYVLGHVLFPQNFGFLFFIGFVLSMCSFYFLTRLREPAHPVHNEPGIVFDEIVQRSLAILRRDKRFRHFLVTDAAHLVALTATGYFAVYAMDKFHLPVSSAGTFTMITMAGMMVANTVGGYLADHYGNKLMFLLLLGSMAAASLIAWWAPNVTVYSTVFFFLACGLSLQGIARLQYVSEISTDAERPLYIAITNTVTAPTVFIGLAAGKIISMYGYEPAFALYAVLGMAATVWTVIKVDEPRNI